MLKKYAYSRSSILILVLWLRKRVVVNFTHFNLIASHLCHCCKQSYKIGIWLESWSHMKLTKYFEVECWSAWAKPRIELLPDNTSLISSRNNENVLTLLTAHSQCLVFGLVVRWLGRREHHRVSFMDEL